MWFPTRSDINRPVQSQKMARDWKFWIYKVEELYYPCSENKGADHFAVTAKLICAFVFAYADCWFSHGAAHLFVAIGKQLHVSVREQSLIRDRYLNTTV